MLIFRFLVRPTTACVYLHPSIMPVAREIVNAIAPASDSAEYINCLGVIPWFEVQLNLNNFKLKETRKCVVKCDIFGVFITLTSKATEDYTIQFINHRGSDSCKREERRNTM